MRLVKVLEVAALAMLFATPALAANVEVSGAWFRALPAGLPAGGYFTLHNNADSEIALTGASSKACSTLMLHRSTNEGGMERMVMVKRVAVPAHGSIAFKPGSYHLMCMKPKPEMKPGGTVSVTLEFADGTKTSADFAVKSAAGK